MAHVDLPSAILVRHLRGRGDTRQQHARAARNGVEVRIGRGAYIARAEWDALGRREQQLVRLAAYAHTRATPPVLSHWSAAVLHDLPFAVERSDDIHVVVGRTAGGRSAKGMKAHSLDVHESDIVEVHGLRCTSPARTAVDLATGSSTMDAVAVADCVVRDVGREALYAAWLRAQHLRGHRRSLDVLSFADDRSESPLESLSRVAIYEAGMPKPELQRSFRDREGLIGYVDFAWPEFQVIGEADGDAKYLDAALRGGRSADRVVLDEKIREDRLRALGWRVVRWRWNAIQDPQRLVRALGAAGLPADPRSRWDDCGSA